MENPVFDSIHRHVSVRHYKKDEVPRHVVEKVVAAGQRASTSSNLQAYSVVVVTAEAQRERLSELADGQAFILDAPVFLVWCADLARLDRVCRLRGTVQVTGYVDNFLTAVMDASIAAQNSALAAESLGLGICYIGALRSNAAAVIELLALPRLVFPVFGMTVGWPIKEGQVKPRLPLQSVLHWDRYEQDRDASLHEYDRTMAATGIYSGRQSPFPGRETNPEEYGWLEHTARRVARLSRTGLKAVLLEQGFELN